MNLSVPVGRSPGLGRKRPYKIGDPADVETTQSMYRYILPHHVKPKGESMGFVHCLGHL